MTSLSNAFIHITPRPLKEDVTLMKGHRTIKPQAWADAHARAQVQVPASNLPPIPVAIRFTPLLQDDPRRQRGAAEAPYGSRLEEILRLERLQHVAAFNEGPAQPPCP